MKKAMIFKKLVSLAAAASMILSMGIAGVSAADMRIKNGADIAGYVMLGAKTKLEVSGAPEGTAKIRWYTGLSTRDKALAAEVDGSTGTFLLDVQKSKKYIFAEAIDANGNILAETDTSLRYGVEFKETQSLFSVNFDEGLDYGWHGYQNIVDANRNYVQTAGGGRIGVIMGNPADVTDPLGKNGKCMKLEGYGFDAIEAANRTFNYAFDTDGKSIYVLEADMQFEDLGDRKLIKVTHQDAAQAASGNTGDGRDSVAITLSGGSFEFYGNTLPAETGKWYNVKYVYDAAHKQLTGLVDNQYLGTAAGVDMTKLGRLSLVDSNTGVMYLDNLKWTKYEPAVQLSVSDLTLTASASDGSDVSIWRSLDGNTFYKYTDAETAAVEALPYPQYFVARGYKDGGFTQSERVDVAAFSAVTAKRTYLDCDFENGYAIDGGSLTKNGEKVFTVSGTNTIENGVLKQAVGASATHEIVESMRDLKGTDSGVITIEADIANVDWGNRDYVSVRFFKDLSSWSNYHDLCLYDTGGSGININYTDNNGNSKTRATGIKYAANVSKHYKIDIDADNNKVTVTIDGQSFEITDIENISFVYFLQLQAAWKAQTVDNVEIYKYEKQAIAHNAKVAEKHYLLSSDGNSDVASGAAVILELTNDSSTKSFTLFAAAYNEDGSLAEIGKRAVELGENGAGNYSFRFSKEYAPEKIKVFSWDAALKSVLPIVDFN